MSIFTLLPIANYEDQASIMPTLRLGSHGNYVIILQQCLYRAGYYDGSINGNFNLKTYDAIREFQKQVGIFPRGIVERKTWKAIIVFWGFWEL